MPQYETTMNHVIMDDLFAFIEITVWLHAHARALVAMFTPKIHTDVYHKTILHVGERDIEYDSHAVGLTSEPKQSKWEQQQQK